jgi:hypothetical protein
LSVLKVLNAERFKMSRLQIRKMGVLSLAKIYGLMMLVISLIIAIPYGLVIIGWSIFGGSMVGGNAGRLMGGGGVVAGIAIMIGLPIFYGIFGFIFGAIGALVYNLFAGLVGGIEIEVEAIQ